MAGTWVAQPRTSRAASYKMQLQPSYSGGTKSALSWVGCVCARPQLHVCFFLCIPRNLRCNCFVKILHRSLANSLVALATQSIGAGSALPLKVVLVIKVIPGLIGVAVVRSFAFQKVSQRLPKLVMVKFFSVAKSVFCSGSDLAQPALSMVVTFRSLPRVSLWVKCGQDGLGFRYRSKGLRSKSAPNNACS